MGRFEEYKPVMVMVAVQFISAGVTLWSRAALLQGMSPRVFVTYRQAIAFLVLAPFAFTRGKEIRSGMGMKTFSLMFLASLIGVTMNNNFYFQGLYMTSSSIGSAMYNLSPAITFVVAAIIGMEQIKIGSIRSIAKILGTVICVGGAASMAFFKGPKLLNPEYLPEKSSILLGMEADNWLLGCFLLFGASWCWSLLLILQVPVTASHPDHLSSVAWLSLFGAIQSAAVTFFIEPNSNSWHINSYLELWTCLFCGAISSGLGFFLQAWCISQRGPLYVSLFNPLCTVIIMIVASIFLHEEIYTGSLIGASGVIGGLYVVLWGKAIEYRSLTIEDDRVLLNEETSFVHILVDDFTEPLLSCNMDEPLLHNKSIIAK